MKRTAALAILALAWLAACMPASAQYEVNDNIRSWYLVDDEGRRIGVPEYVTGPGTPPDGVGSLVLTAPPSGGIGVASHDLSGRRFGALARYSTYIFGDDPTQTIGFAFDVDYDLNDDDTHDQGRLTFTPDAWFSRSQQWNSHYFSQGTWVASDTSAGGSNGLCTAEVPCRSLTEYWPRIGIRANGGQVLFILAGVAPGAQVALDDFYTSDNWYNFEPRAVDDSSPCGGFTDIPSGAIYCAAVAWVKNRGVTLGCTATAYCPDAPVTRAQMSSFMKRLGSATGSGGAHASSMRDTALALDQRNFMCYTYLDPAPFPRTAHVTGQFGGRPTGPGDFAMNVVYGTEFDSSDPGFKVTPLDAIAGNSGTRIANASVRGLAYLLPDTGYTFAMRVVRATGTADIAKGSTCSVDVELRGAAS